MINGMDAKLDEQLPQRLAARLAQPLPGRWAQARFEPELSFGRHYAPPPPDARAAAVLAVLVPHEGRWQIPLMVRPQTLTDHAGQISLPGGTIDPGETSQEAALREFEEELGVDRREVELLGCLSPLYLFVSNFQVVPCVGVMRRRPRLAPNPHEVAELLEVPVDHLLDAANCGQHSRQFNGLHFSAPHIAFGQHRIWGATGMILGELIELLRDVTCDSQI
jgi:8-oxo-dGTP pyrophosphatase MutT (NUDIX family)